MTKLTKTYVFGHFKYTLDLAESKEKSHYKYMNFIKIVYPKLQIATLQSFTKEVG
jgi:hypothetical protein